MPTAPKERVTAARQASRTRSRLGSLRALRTIWRASSASRTRRWRSSRSRARRTEVRASAGVLLEQREALGARTSPVLGAVDREQAAQHALVVVDGCGEQVERVPGVGGDEVAGLGDVAVLEDLLADPVVRHEAPRVPVVGLGELALDHVVRQAPADDVLDHALARARDDLELVPAAQADGGLLEAGEHGDALDEHLQVLTGLLVGPRFRGRLVADCCCRLHLHLPGAHSW